MRAIGVVVLAVGVGPAGAWAQAGATRSAEVQAMVSVDFPLVALTSVRVIDGTGGPVRENQTVMLANGRIRTVGPTGSIIVPRTAHAIDLPGHTVIPGLVGLHNHTFYTTANRQAQLNFTAPRLYLASGVTTIRTTGSYSPYSELNLRRDIDAGRVPGPRMHITGPYITGTGAGGSMYRVADADDARRVVAYWAEEGATWFKVYTQISREELAAAIDEAHQLGVKVTGHLCSVTFREAVALGIDNLEHGFFTNTDYDADKPLDQCPADAMASLLEVAIESAEVRETIRVMVEAGVGLTSTLAVYELFVPGRPPLDPRVADVLAPGPRDEYLAARTRLAEAGTTTVGEIFRRAMDFEVAFVAAGGLLAAGVDPTGNGGALPGFGDQRNYELLREAGFDPPTAIRIMSLNGARLLGIDADLGSIEEGKVADLVVIRGDPATRAADIRQVVTVFKDGVGFDAERLIGSVRGLVGVR